MSSVIKVGIFVTLCLVVLAWLVLAIEDLRIFGTASQRVVAVFDSVVGLDDKAPVRVAGVRVGRVDGIGLEGQRARVELLLEIPVALTRGAYAKIANAGILGDKYVELVPGEPGAPPLPAGSVLAGETPVSFDETLEKINELGGSLSQLTGSLGQEDLGGSISRLLGNLEATSADIRALVAANRDQIGSTISNFDRASATLAAELPKLASQIERVLARVDGVVEENRDDLKGSLSNIRELTEKVETSVDNLNAISSQIASGEGTLGKLVYSAEAHDGLVSTLDSIKDGVGTLGETLGRMSKIEFELGMEGSYFTDAEESRTAVSIDVVASRPDRFYRVELVDDPQGKTERRTDVVTTTLPDGSVETTTIERLTTEDEFTLSAQFGFSLGQADLRAGLFESSGGAGLDYHFLDKRLRISAEAFDFNRDLDLEPRLRLYGRYSFHPNLYVIGGYDDVLESDRASLFLGAGVRWKDDDLKYLLGSVPRF